MPLEIEYRRDLEAKLHEVTRLDELTQIGNRHAFFQCYSKLISEYKRPLLIFIALITSNNSMIPKVTSREMNC